jgi:hypothetical protein
LDVGREGVWRIAMQGHHMARTLSSFYNSLYLSFGRGCCKKYNSSKQYRIPFYLGKNGINFFDQLHNFLEAIPPVTAVLSPTHNRSLEEK